ncbi:MAG: hypothetical protein KatS3mg076_0177 [Candidatus Binatia bacterium]|nr:MAG: hypothetical protein KatS3mg076_0177 [Candidatus Binatia bacterium]
MDGSQRWRTLLRRFSRARVLVVGDLMLDEFVWGDVERISPEAPVPVVRVTRESVHLGGAANVVHNVRAMGAKAAACGVVGRDARGRRVVGLLRRIGAGVGGVVVSDSTETTSKTRVLAQSQQVVRIDRESYALGRGVFERLARYVERTLGSFDVLVVSDYAKGVVTPDFLDFLGRAARRAGIPWIVDPKKPNFGHYRGMTLVTPNLSEAGQASGVEIRDRRGLRLAGKILLRRWEAGAVLVTRGEQGMTLFTREGKVREFPAAARQVYDVTGAGDTVVAACAVALAAGASLEEAAYLANLAAGIVVGKVGTATVGKQELRGYLDGSGA